MANLTRLDPFTDTMSLRQAMDRLFEDSFVSPLSWRALRGDGALAPAIDIHDTADDVVITAALPGVKPEDVEITLTGQTLVIRGEFKDDETGEADRYIYRERRSGAFNRQVELPLRVQGDRAEATFEHGLLRLRVPKADEVKPRQIQIRPGSALAGNGSHSK